jgi:hypothetical protein
MNFPGEIPVEDIVKPGSEYEADKLALYNALYVGGEEFRKHLDVMLPMRGLEKASGGQGTADYASRKARAQYTNYAGGIEDWLTAAVFRNNPGFEVKGGDKGYWKDLNENADGFGTPFYSLCRAALNVGMTNLRPYFKVSFPSADSKDAVVSVVDAIAVDDWQYSEKGEFMWGRTHTSANYRKDDEIKASDLVRHCWTYYAPDKIAIYEADEAPIAEGLKKSKKKAPGINLDPKKMAKLVSLDGHDLGCSPLFDIRFTRSQWVMDRIFETLQALFRREASITYALDMQAFALPVITLAGGNVPSIAGSEVMALKLQPGESFGFAAPPSQIFEPLFKDADRLKENLRDVIQAMPVNASAIPQAGRLSGSAVNAMRDPEKTLFDSFAQPVKEAAKRMLEKIAEFRRENVEIELTGFEQGDGVVPSLDDLPLGENNGEGLQQSGAGSESAGKEQSGKAS